MDIERHIGHSAWVSEAAEWAVRVCDVARVWRLGESSIRDRFEKAGRIPVNDSDAIAAICAVLGKDPSLIDAWQAYCEDRRGTPAPFWKGAMVGFYDEGVQEGREYEDRASACSTYIVSEAAWVLERRRVAR